MPQPFQSLESALTPSDPRDLEKLSAEELQTILHSELQLKALLHETNVSTSKLAARIRQHLDHVKKKSPSV